MNRQKTNEYEALALSSLGWILSDSDRATRLLAVTELTPEDLRDRIGDPVLLAATLGFLEAHEPDLIACAAALDIAPDALVAARAGLEA